MVAGASLTSWQGFPIEPWPSKYTLPCARTRDIGCSTRLGREPATIAVAALRQGRHIAQRFDGACLKTPPPSPRQPPAAPRDAVLSTDVNECPNAGFSLDLFPATTLFVTATIVDPAAKHWDPAARRFVTGPLTSRLYFQVAGRHPDLNRNGRDDYVDIATGESKDPDGSGVPYEVKQCLKQLHELDTAELAQHNARLSLMDAERRARQSKGGYGGEYRGKGFDALRDALRRDTERAEAELREFRACEARFGMRMHAER